MTSEITINTMSMVKYEMTIWQVKRAWQRTKRKYCGIGLSTKFKAYPIDIEPLLNDMHERNSNSIVQVRRI